MPDALSLLSHFSHLPYPISHRHLKNISHANHADFLTRKYHSESNLTCFAV